LFARVEQIRKFRLIEQKLTAEDEELTPTMKLKRKLVNEKYRPLIEEIRRHHSDVPILTADYEASGPVRTDGSAEAYDKRPLLAFCGIADPESFRRSLAESGVNVLDLLSFPDHHWYGEEELKKLGEEARERGAAGLVTTEKDQMRIAGFFRGPLPLWVLPVRLRLLTDEKLWRDRLSALADRFKHEVA
jgi:tetraacyldisaccharide-1-P 4'-kinase